ncbi:MAG: NblA/ycf18 family protein [Thermosynechococcaceae cyanobacterium]
MNALKLELSLEQEFSLLVYKETVEKLNRDQAQELLIKVLQQMMIKDNVIRSLMKSELKSEFGFE